MSGRAKERERERERISAKNTHQNLSDPILQELEHGRTVATVHLDLVHQHGIRPSESPRRDKLGNLLVLVKLLATKLRRGIRLDNQLRVTLEQLSKLLVVLSRQASLGRHVADEHSLALQRRKVDRLLVDVEGRELIEGRGPGRRGAEPDGESWKWA